MLGITLALLVALMKSLGELAGKIYLSGKKDVQQIDEYQIYFWGKLIFFLLLIIPASFKWLPEFTIQNTLELVFSTIIATAWTICGLKALKYWELSLVSPLMAFTIPFLLLSGFIIAGELPNSYGLIWVWIIFVWTYFLQLHEIQSWFFWPLRAIFKNTGSRYAIITALLLSITAAYDKVLVVEFGIIHYIFLHNILAILMIMWFVFFFRKKTRLMEIFQKKSLKKICTLWVITGVWLLLQLLAVAYTLVVYVISIKRASGVFSVIFGAIFFREKHIFQKFLAAGIIFLGVCCIALLGNI